MANWVIATRGLYVFKNHLYVHFSKCMMYNKYIKYMYIYEVCIKLYDFFLLLDAPLLRFSDFCCNGSNRNAPL